MVYRVNKIARRDDVYHLARHLNAFRPSPLGKVPNSVFKQVFNRGGYELSTPNFIHDGEGYTLSLEVPGTEKRDIEVRLDPVGRTLGVVVKEYNIEVDENKEVVKQQYAVSIPGGADVSKDPKATLELGILSVTFPEDVATQPRTIEVTAK